jgi:hypothetical protein
MSPLALPRSLLDPWIDELVPQVDGALRDVVQLKTRPTFEEQWPDSYCKRPCKGQGSCVTIRKHTHTEDHNDRNTC